MHNRNLRRHVFAAPSTVVTRMVAGTVAAATVSVTLTALTMPAASAATTSGCASQGYSVDPDPAGLNVRSAPSANAKVVGRLYAGLDERTLRTDGPAFTILGYTSGWVKITNAQSTTIQVDGTGEQRNYTGTGWVSAKRVTPLFFFDSDAEDLDFAANDRKAYAKPSLRSAVVEDWAKMNIDRQYSTFGTDPLIVGCSGRWLRVSYRVTGYYDRTGTWTEYEQGQPERGRTVTAWVQGERP